MHAVRRELVVAQAERLDLALHLVELPSPCPNERYEEEMRRAIAVARPRGSARLCSAICTSRTSASTASSPSQGPGSGALPALGAADRTARTRDARRRHPGRDHLRRPGSGTGRDRRTRVGRTPARRAPRGSRPVRRGRRVPHVRLERAGVPRRRSPSRPARSSNATGSSSATSGRRHDTLDRDISVAVGELRQDPSGAAPSRRFGATSVRERRLVGERFVWSGLVITPMVSSGPPTRIRVVDRFPQERQ